MKQKTDKLRVQIKSVSLAKFLTQSQIESLKRSVGERFVYRELGVGKDKTFQIPVYRLHRRYISVIIAHEMLHFMFYDYFYKRYPKYRRPKYNFFVWHISEIFNTVIQNSPAWFSCFKLKSLGYPEHEKIVRRISRTFYRRKVWNINMFTNEISKEVQKIKNSPK